MSLRISESRYLHITFVDLQGQLTIGAGVNLFHEFIEQQAHRFAPQLMINLNGLTYLDVAGLAELTTASQTIADAGGFVRILNVNQLMEDSSTVPRLHVILDSSDSVSRTPDPSGPCAVSENYVG
jgi:anti-anti-sigma factor